MGRMDLSRVSLASAVKMFNSPNVTTNPQMRLYLHSRLWRQLRTHWMGPPKRSLPVICTQQGSFAVDRFQLVQQLYALHVPTHISRILLTLGLCSSHRLDYARTDGAVTVVSVRPSDVDIDFDAALVAAHFLSSPLHASSDTCGLPIPFRRRPMCLLKRWTRCSDLLLVEKTCY